MKAIKLMSLSAMLFIGIIANAAGGIVLNCTQNKDFNKPFLQLSVDQGGYASLDLIDPAALRPVAHLQLFSNAYQNLGRIISVDQWESRVGQLQLVAIYDAGTFESKHVYFDARFARDEIHQSYGLTKFNELSEAKIPWVCEQGLE